MTTYRFNDQGAKRFCEHLHAGARILVSESFDVPFFVNADTPPKASMPPKRRSVFFSPPKESYDAVWVDRSLFHFPPALCQRSIQIFFSALKPGGILFASFLEDGEFTLEEYESMLRQSGFNPILEGRNEGDAKQIAILARRI